ncbi:MAG: Uma2 family endonuclease [Methylacidiphilaceae bacterium]|nr:Uma2 family endonuclease [Candidatus Methylacidiphilaceae bacterium]
MPTMTFGPRTVKDWLATPEGEHWELIHGNLIVTEETGDNSRLAGRIEWEIRKYLEGHPLGVVERNIAFAFPGTTDADREGVVPDLCYIPNDQFLRWDGEAHVQKDVIPALVVEILSPSTRQIDLVDKVEIYREAGIQEYWIFDRCQKTIRIYRFVENGEEPIAFQSFDETVTTPLLPGFSLEMPQVSQALRTGRDAQHPSRP